MLIGQAQAALISIVDTFHPTHHPSEVLVNFTHDPDDVRDRPAVLGQLFTGADLPPFSAGMDSDVNHIGTISGWHSQGLDGQGYNQWVVDDTTRQLRMRLASSTATSQLNLGYLIQQAPTSAQRGRYRGQGFKPSRYTQV